MNAHTKLPCSVDLTRIMDELGIKEIRRVEFPYGGADRHFSVTLRCGGVSGIGATVGDAYNHACELNADWLWMLAA